MELLLISSETVTNKKTQTLERSGFCQNDSLCKPNHLIHYDVFQKISPENFIYQNKDKTERLNTAVSPYHQRLANSRETVSLALQLA